MLFTGAFSTSWQTDEKRESKFVFIGRSLPKELLTNGFLSCEVANDGELRFPIGQLVLANVVKDEPHEESAWEQAMVINHWDQGNAYRLQLFNSGGEIWAPIDSDDFVKVRDDGDSLQQEGAMSTTRRAVNSQCDSHNEVLPVLGCTYAELIGMWRPDLEDTAINAMARNVEHIQQRVLQRMMNVPAWASLPVPPKVVPSTQWLRECELVWEVLQELALGQPDKSSEWYCVIKQFYHNSPYMQDPRTKRWCQDMFLRCHREEEELCAKGKVTPAAKDGATKKSTANTKLAGVSPAAQRTPSLPASAQQHGENHRHARRGEIDACGEY
jgi:hypothetical protein